MLNEAGTLLNIHSNEYDESIRHNLVKKGLTEAFMQFPGRTFQNIPLAVKRRLDNPEYVTWTGTDTILGEWNDTFTLLMETRVTRVVVDKNGGPPIMCALLRNLNTDKDRIIVAKVRKSIFMHLQSGS